VIDSALALRLGSVGHAQGPSAALVSALSKVGARLRLGVSAPNAGEYDVIVDANGGASTNQTDADRKPAAATSTNGLPVATWDGTDVLVWPNVQGTTKWGVACWVKPGTVSSAQLIYSRFNGTNASTQRVWQTGWSATGVMTTSVWISTAGGTGRNINSAGSTIAAGVWRFFYSAYDSSLGGDANVMHFLDGVAIAQSGNSNIGAGGTLGALQSSTGNAFIGGQSDSDTPASPLSNNTQTGPILYTMTDTLTVAEQLALMDQDRPI